MKQLIVMLASIVLGVFIFKLILGPGDGSIKASMDRLWRAELRQRTERDVNDL